MKVISAEMDFNTGNKKDISGTSIEGQFDFVVFALEMRVLPLRITG
jgi:hypothetical protein